MAWRRAVLSLLSLSLAASLTLAVDLPTGPCVTGFTLTPNRADAWCELTLGQGASAVTLGLSRKRASLVAAGGLSLAQNGDALAANGQTASYRLLKLDDTVALEREGVVLVSTRLTRTEATVVGVKSQGLEVAFEAPQPVEPPYFDDDFLRTDKETGGWQPLSGQWHIGEYRDKLVAAMGLAPQATWYEARQPGLSLVGSDWWSDLRASANLRGEAPAGLVFAYQRGHGGLFRLRAGQAELVALEGDKQQVVAHAAYTPEAGRWVRLTVSCSGGTVEGSVNGRPLVGATMPLLSGQVGVWCDGPAQFDDYRVEPLRRLVEANAAKGRLRLAPFDAGTVSARADLTRDGSATLALTAVQPVSLNVKRAAGQSRYEFREGSQVLGQGPLPTDLGGAPTMMVRRRGPLFEALVGGRRVGLTAQPSAPPSFAEVPEPGRLSGVVAEALPDAPDALVDQSDFTPLRDDWVDRDESVRTFPDLWQPEAGQWRLKDDCLVGHAAGQPARIWYRETLPSDTGLTAAIESLSDGASLTLMVGGGTGLRLVLNASTAVLSRDGREVARTPLAQAPAQARLWRDADWALAEIDGQRLAWRDPKPSGAGQIAVALRDGDVSLSSLTVTAQNGFSSSFGAVDTLWREAGDWQWTSGMACIAWSYWLTGDGRTAPAWLWRREALGHDVTVRFQVGEHTDGYDHGNLTHQHFPYSDISLMLDGDGQNPDSGYRFVIGENGGRGIRLYRAGQSVAFEPGFRIVLGGHCNTPRAIRVLATRQGGEVTLTCNEQRQITWTDPQPLTGGGVVGLGVSRCRANFHDLVATRYRQP